MKQIVTLLFFCLTLTNGYGQRDSNTNLYFSLKFFDSSLKAHCERIVDLTFPPSINKNIHLRAKASTCISGGKKYQLTRFKSKGGMLKRERVIYKKRDDNNFQFFYLDFPKYMLGVGYYAYGDKVDNSVNDKIPYIPYRLDAYSIFNDNNERYVIVYDDQTEIPPIMNNSVRIFMLDSNLLPQKVIFINKSNNNLLYDIKLNRVYSLNKDFNIIYSTDFKSLFELSKDLQIQNVDLKSLKGVPFFHWRLK
jgi:hypothetical protein